jgi:SAM-dependent methyltransferase
VAFGSARTQRRVWDRRVDTWDSDASPNLAKVFAAVLEACDPRPGMTAVDLGCGTGQIALPLAKAGAQVTAVDVSPEMIERLRARLHEEGVDGVDGVVASMEQFRLPPESVDLVVTNYALHHLRLRDKQELVQAVARWLRPGGRFVIGDMMFGRGGDARDRAIIRSKAALMVRRGPAGWWRLAKNLVKFGLRIRERPMPVDQWVRYFVDAGLVEVTSQEVVAEAAVVVGRKPA